MEPFPYCREILATKWFLGVIFQIPEKDPRKRSQQSRWVKVIVRSKGFCCTCHLRLDSVRPVWARRGLQLLGALENVGERPGTKHAGSLRVDCECSRLSFKWNPAKLEPIAKWYSWFGLQPSCVPCPGLWSSAILTATRPFGPSSSRATEGFCAPTECKAWRNRDWQMSHSKRMFETSKCLRRSLWVILGLGDVISFHYPCEIKESSLFGSWHFGMSWKVKQPSQELQMHHLISSGLRGDSIGDPTNPKYHNSTPELEVIPSVTIVTFNYMGLSDRQVPTIQPT